jgi:hypothetical protein
MGGFLDTIGMVAHSVNLNLMGCFFIYNMRVMWNIVEDK